MSDSSHNSGFLNSPLVRTAKRIWQIQLLGWQGIKLWNLENIIAFLLVSLILILLSYRHSFLTLLARFGFELQSSVVGQILLRMHWLILPLVFLGTGIFFLGFLRGILPYLKRQKLQSKIDVIGLANAKGEVPFAIREIELDENKSKLLLTANGIGLDRFIAKKGDFESAFQQIIETMDLSDDRQTIQINMCKRELKRNLPFYEIDSKIQKPYTFCIGDSHGGFLTADIRDLPHLLIAGSTGGGKSVFFRSAFTSILKHSTRLQVYLIDLKNGVEVKEFGPLPNVRIAKTEEEAVQMLAAIHSEMKRRFVFMEENSIKKINPFEHKKDLIIVGIDEASVLFGKTRVTKQKEDLVKRARDLADEIAKLSRAAGIHLILATQKAVKDSIDTKVMENLTGRMVFKMSTHAGSNTALGNARAFNLPDIKGRGIWGGGNKFIEVQAPFLSEEDFFTECELLATELSAKKDLLFSPMIEFSTVKTEAAEKADDELNRNTELEENAN